MDYGLDDTPRDGAIPLLKLHGSLNWGHCGKCDVVVPWGMAEFFGQSHFDIFDDTKAVLLTCGARIGELVHPACGTTVDDAPVLVPPTWNKGEHHKVIARVWARAACGSSDAENVFIIGYSLPPSDEFFRYLYGLGTVKEGPHSNGCGF